jgi:hypothetical protein
MQMQQLRWPKPEVAMRVQEVLDHLHNGVELLEPIESGFSILVFPYASASFLRLRSGECRPLGGINELPDNNVRCNPLNEGLHSGLGQRHGMLVRRIGAAAV